MPQQFGTRTQAATIGTMTHAAKACTGQYTSHDQRLIWRKGMKFVAEQRPPMASRMTPEKGFAPKMPRSRSYFLNRT